MRPSELDSRFAELFHQPAQFPYPDAFLRIEKTYSSVNVANMNGMSDIFPTYSITLLFNLYIYIHIFSK